MPGCVTEGETLTEARDMARDAIRCYLESLAKHGEIIPVEKAAIIQEQVEVSFPQAV